MVRFTVAEYVNVHNIFNLVENLITRYLSLV